MDYILVRFLYQPACRQARIHYDSINNQEWVFYLGFLDKIIDCVGGLFLSYVDIYHILFFVSFLV